MNDGLGVVSTRRTRTSTKNSFIQRSRPGRTAKCRLGEEQGGTFGTVASGTVVLEVKITEAGKPEVVKVLRDIALLTPEAIRAVRDWRLMPAKLDGKPLGSNISLAFMFRVPSRYYP